jgi:hypothetical protein
VFKLRIAFTGRFGRQRGGAGHGSVLR